MFPALFSSDSKFSIVPSLLLIAGSFASVIVRTATAQTEQTSVPTLTVTTRLVVLDVTVTDARGNPVTDLTRDDFRVYEDNKFRVLRSFDPPSANALPAASTGAAALRTTFDPSNPSAFGKSAVTILMLDQLNTHFADSSYARREMRDFLRQQPELLPQPTTLLTIYDNHTQTLAPFTRDREALLKALAAAPVKNAWELDAKGTSEDGPIDRMQQSLEALEQMTAQYARIQGRKNLLWIGGGFPSPDPTTIDGSDAVEVRNTMRHITNMLLNARVTLYAVDPTSTAAGVTEITTIEQSAFATAANGISSGMDPFNASDDFDRLAPVTGGRIIRSRNDVSAQIASALTLADSSYTLGYVPDAAPDGNPYRHIRVQVIRPGLHVAARDGYYSSESAEQAPAHAVEEQSLSNALRSNVAWNALHIAVDLQPGETDQPMLVRVNAADLTWTTTPDGGHTAHVVIAAVAFGPNNKELGKVMLEESANAPGPTDVNDASHHADFKITLPKGIHGERIRIAVMDKGSSRIGAIDVH